MLSDRAGRVCCTERSGGYNGANRPLVRVRFSEVLMSGTFPGSPVSGRFILLSLFLVLLRSRPRRRSGTDRAVLQEEQEDYYRKWLQEDVVYIITDEERDVFDGLRTVDEKEQFIEQFWRRRDPDMRTAINEYKEEHYRRIAYANDHFFSARPGGGTDRGRTYILWGPPDDREMRPSGGRYERLPYEGGGTTTTYPFERWLYRHIPGIGSDVELEFVDQSGTGEYRLALGLEEKDALLHSEGGLTIAEELGMMDKSQRPYFTPSSAHNPFIQGITGMRAKDRPFARMARYFDVQKAPDIRYKDLQKLVDSRVLYHSLPFDLTSNAIKLDEARVLISITVEVRNQDLTFKAESGIHQGHLRLYGRVLNLGRTHADRVRAGNWRLITKPKNSRPA